MEKSTMGKQYKIGETIVKQGDKGDCMYVIQSGKVEVVREKDGKEARLAELSDGDFFGEMALFEAQVRSATVRVTEDAYILTVDKKTLLRRIQQDPSMAFRLLETMSKRLRALDHQHTRIKAGDRRNWDSRPDTYDGV